MFSIRSTRCHKRSLNTDNVQYQLSDVYIYHNEEAIYVFGLELHFHIAPNELCNIKLHATLGSWLVYKTRSWLVYKTRARCV